MNHMSRCNVIMFVAVFYCQGDVKFIFTNVVSVELVLLEHC